MFDFLLGFRSGDKKVRGKKLMSLPNAVDGRSKSFSDPSFLSFFFSFLLLLSSIFSFLFWMIQKIRYLRARRWWNPMMWPRLAGSGSLWPSLFARAPANERQLSTNVTRLIVVSANSATYILVPIVLKLYIKQMCNEYVEYLFKLIRFRLMKIKWKKNSKEKRNYPKGYPVTLHHV